MRLLGPRPPPGPASRGVVARLVAPLVLPLLLAACGAPDPARPAAQEALRLLDAGDLDGARDAAARARTGDARRYTALEESLRGARAFRQSEAVEAAAQGTEAAPDALERARVLAEDAAAFFRRAVAAEGAGPEARRNLERALLRVARLSEAQRRAGSPSTRRTPVVLPPPPGAKPPQPPAEPRLPGTEEAPPAGPAAAELSPEQVLGVLRMLAEKERAKRVLRRAERAPPAGGPERDW